MGTRKHKMAEERKLARKTLYIAKLSNCPTSHRRSPFVENEKGDNQNTF
jgi:hypothetical protein